MTTPFNPQPAVGSWISSGSAVVTEVAADAGFDWLLLDLEHASGTESELLNQLRGFRGSPTKPIVRVGSLEPALMARILDWGAAGIMVPHVNSVEEAVACTQAVRYPPHGLRGVSRSVRAFGYGRKPFTGSDPSVRPLLITQIETIEAVESADEIAAVDGVDILFIGPADLQFDLQARPQLAVRDFQACLKKVVQACQRCHKQAGILVRDIGDLKSLIDLGMTWLAVESDLGLLRSGYQRALELWKSASGSK